MMNSASNILKWISENASIDMSDVKGEALDELARIIDSVREEGRMQVFGRARGIGVLSEFLAGRVTTIIDAAVFGSEDDVNRAYGELRDYVRSKTTEAYAEGKSSQLHPDMGLLRLRALRHIQDARASLERAMEEQGRYLIKGEG